MFRHHALFIYPTSSRNPSIQLSRLFSFVFSVGFRRVDLFRHQGRECTNECERGARLLLDALCYEPSVRDYRREDGHEAHAQHANALFRWAIGDR